MKVQRPVRMLFFSGSPKIIGHEKSWQGKGQCIGLLVNLLMCERGGALYSVRARVQCCGSGSGISDLGSGIRCFFDPWIRDPVSGMGKEQGSGYGMNNPDHISQRLETIFWVKIRIRDPRSGWKKMGAGIRDKHPGSATLPQSNSFSS